MTGRYWDWTKYAHNIYENPIFDGSPGSMSGDGYFVPHPGTNIGFGEMPKGLGGGCISSGPFKGRMLNLGPFGYDDLATAHGVLPSYSFDYNPRCLTRDLNPELARINHNESIIFDLVHKSQTLPEFLVALSRTIGPIVNNPHAGGHFVIGGAGNDFFASAGDPTFYLHHSQLDRMWAKWQSLDPKHRMYAVSGTNTMLNDPPSAETSLNDILHMGIEDLAPPAIKQVMTTNGPLYCYRYDDDINGQTVQALTGY
jgi:tyrosinase